MRAVVQRVLEASVAVGGREISKIDKGILVFLGVGRDDDRNDAHSLAEKIAHLRIFSDADGKMNLSVMDVGGGALVVSQFTLWGDCRKGRRPSYIAAAPPQLATPLYEAFIQSLEGWVGPVARGIFQENMQVGLINDGPVTLLLDTRKIL